MFRTANWLALLGTFPLIINAICGFIAKSLGCIIHEGGIIPCQAVGTDIGMPLHYGGMFGLVFFSTWPSAATAFFMYLALTIRWASRRFPNRRGKSD